MVNFNRGEMIILNIGEKINLYKEKLNHKNFQDFGRAANCSGDWLNDLSKAEEIKVVSMHNLINLCDYLGVTINQLVVNDEVGISNSQDIEVNHITDCDDIGILLRELATIANSLELKMDGVLMNTRAKAIFKDSLYAVTTLVKQHL